MADFLGGLLGGGGGGGGLYDDLLTPQQQSQLSGRGLLSMAGAFADAAMPSRFPVPLGAALGKAAAAMGSGRDEAALSLLKAGMTAQEIKAMRQKMALNEQISPILLRMLGLGGTVAPPAAAAPALPSPRAGPEPLPIDLGGTPTGERIPLDDPPSITQYGMPARRPLPPYTGLRPAWPGQGQSPPLIDGANRNALNTPLDSPPTAAERLEWAKTVGPSSSYLPLEDWVAQHRAGAGSPAGVPAGGPSAQPQDAPLGAGSSLNDRYGGILAMAGGPGGASGSSLPPQDELLRQQSGFGGPGGLLTPASYNGGGAGTPPFGAGGDDEVGSGGDTRSPEYLAKRERDLALVEKYESGGRNIEQQVVGPQGGYNPSVGRVTGPSSASGYRQMIDSTWRNAARMAGIDTAQYPRAIDAPRDVQKLAAEALYDKRGLADWAPYNRALARAVGWSGPVGDGGMPGGGSGGGAAPLATPPGAGAALATPSGGVIPGTGMTAQQLGALNALTKMGGLGDPFNSLLETYYKSPGYLGEAAGATKRGELGVELELRPKLEAAIAWAKIDPNINEAERKAQIERYSKQLEQMRGAELEPAPNGILVPDGAGGMKRVQATKLQAAQAAAGLGVPALGIPPLVNPPAGSGAPAVSPVGEPVLTSGQQASDTKMAETSVTEYKAANDAARLANGRIQQYGQMAQAAQGFTSGPNAERWYVLKSQLKDLGWIKGTDVPDMEVFQNAARKMQVIAAPKGQGGVSNYERELFASTVPQIVTSPEGLAKAIDIARRLDEYDVKVAGIHRDVAQSNRGRPDSLAADARIAALGPPITPEEMQALDALRSPGGAGAAAAPTQSAPATPGAIKTPYGTITPVR